MMSSWSPLDLQFPDLTVEAGIRLLPMQELENYIDDAFEKINRLRILGRFYVVNGAEYANLADALNDLWSKGINNVEILLRSGVDYTLPNITIASNRQVIIRGLGGRPNLTVAGGGWYGTVILENVNVTFTGTVNDANGTNTPTIVFRNCSITLSQQFRAENGTVVLKDCSFTSTDNYFFLFNIEGFFLCDNVNATPFGSFVGSNSTGNGRLRFFFFNSTIKRQAVPSPTALVSSYGSLFAFNTVFDISQCTANPTTVVPVVFADGTEANWVNSYFVLYGCEIRGNGSEKNFFLTEIKRHRFICFINSRFLNGRRVSVFQSSSPLGGTVVIMGCLFEQNKSYTSFEFDYYVVLVGYYSIIVSGSRFYYTGGTKNSYLNFLSIRNVKQCVLTDNHVENAGFLYYGDDGYNPSDTIVPSLLIANNVIRNCFNKCMHLTPNGHLFLVNNLIYHDYEQSWDNNGVYEFVYQVNFYGGGIFVHLYNAWTSYTRNQTLDDPLNIVIANNVIIRRLLNAIMFLIGGDANLFAYRVFVYGNVIIDCDPERLLSPSQWTIYNTFDNKRKGVGVLMDAASTTLPAQKFEPIIMNNYFINTRYAVYHALGKYGYYDGTKCSYQVIGNYYFRRGGAIASYLNPDTATDVYWFDNIGMDVTAGTNANVIRTQQQGFALPSSVPTNEGSYVFPRTKQYDCAGGFAGGYPFGYIPSKIEIFPNLMLPDGSSPNYTPLGTWYNVSFRSIYLNVNQDLRFQVIPRLFGSKTRNYRRMFLDVVLYVVGTGSITFNVVRINPSTGGETTVVNNYQINTGSGINTAKIPVEATYGGYWIYALRVTAINGSPQPVVYLTGLWLGVDEYYDYGTDSV